jgi:MYXO-CTERM domain-containing protein
MARIWLTGAAALLALAFGAHARAQECTSDDDCDDGYECDLGPVATQDCAPAAAGVADAGACDSTPSPRSGECEPRKMTCDTDADCVKGLTCLHRDGDVACASPPALPDGGVPETPDCGTPDPGPGECAYVLVECKKDSDCDDGLECSLVSKTSTCEGSGSAGCMPGQQCPPPEAMESCTETTHSYCFPPRVDCTSDDDCDDGARCVELPDDAKEDPPPGWEGADALCFPEAFALALEQRVDFEGGEGSRSEDSSANSAGGGDSPAAGRGASGGAKSGSDEDAPAKDNDVVAPKEDTKDDGCAVNAAGAGGSRAWILLGVAALWLRRRRAGVR